VWTEDTWFQRWHGILRSLGMPDLVILAFDKLYHEVIQLDVEERRIVWDENKSVDNKRKHGIGFETARFVFADPNRIWRFDRSEDNASAEDRWQTLGVAEGVTFVVYTECEAEGSNETRIITARLAGQSGKEKLQWALSYRRSGLVRNRLKRSAGK